MMPTLQLFTPPRQHVEAACGGGWAEFRLDIMERINTHTHRLIMKAVNSGVFVQSAAGSAVL